MQGPPWLEQIKFTPELAYRYQITERELNNVLESDLEALKNIDQPKLVEQQLEQLYVDLELEGLSTKLKLDDGVTTSSCSSSSGSEDMHCTSLLKVSKGEKVTKNLYRSIMTIEHFIGKEEKEEATRLHPTSNDL